MEDIRAVRTQLGLTQTEFADRLGLHQSTVSRLETGEMEIDKRTSLAVRALVADSSVHSAPPEEQGDREGLASADGERTSPDECGASIGGQAQQQIASEASGAEDSTPVAPSGRAPGVEVDLPVRSHDASAPGDLFDAEPLRGAA